MAAPSPLLVRSNVWLSFNVAGRFICAKVRLVLEWGATNEEIGYNRQKNHWSVISMRRNPSRR